MVDGVALYLRIVPAVIVRGHRREHPAGEHVYPLIITLFDEQTNKRISNARVSASISEINHPGTQRKLEPMLIAGTITYGSYFDLSRNGPQSARAATMEDGREDAGCTSRLGLSWIGNHPAGRLKFNNRLRFSHDVPGRNAAVSLSLSGRAVEATVVSITEQPWDPKAIAATIDELSALRADLLALSARLSDSLRAVHPDHADSAANLVHYVELRRHDVRALQDRLAWIGVSSLGRAESHVLANIDKVLGLLHRLAGRSWTSLSGEEPAGIRTAAKLLESNTCALLGKAPAKRSVRIMVTLASEAASDYGLVRGILASGMDCARINCAHDDASVWAAMVANIRRARDELQRPCPILFDLAGPKVRTGPIEPGPAVLKWRPQRDEFGRVLAPARILLRPGHDQRTGSRLLA